MSPIFKQKPGIPEMKLPLRDRKNVWQLWKKDKNSGHYSCTQCHNVTFCAGERYDLLVCWYCFFPEAEGLSPYDSRRAERAREEREDPELKRVIQRKPQESKKS